jgi:hypothetical protein
LAGGAKILFEGCATEPFLAGGAKILFEGCATEPFLAGGAKILFEGCATEPFFHSLQFKPPRMLQIYLFFQGRIHFFQ